MLDHLQQFDSDSDDFGDFKINSGSTLVVQSREYGAEVIAKVITTHTTDFGDDDDDFEDFSASMDQKVIIPPIKLN